ncbi:hypothetical protein [Pseudomonas fluorescens]|uniref:hypothetical protein n=1 Tax=Pseudomonas fluorescens TaxID=294 RepID=UPI0005FC298C|nr:hypothetical protein [Pseudomonas fluorescens]KJZ40259.1 membrane protein [Pseudomonas fluorescens]
MDSNKDSGTNLAFWLPGSAVIFSLVVSTFALTREPFLEPRPIGAQFQAQLPIEARLWQDPFDALERYRKKLNDIDSPDAANLCAPRVSPPPGAPTPPDIMVSLVEGGPYADEVERRRRTRYALLAGFKNSHRVPDQEQYIHCLRLAADLSVDPSPDQHFIDVPYEIFVSNPFDPPKSLEGAPQPAEQTIVFWLKQDALGSQPLQQLEKLRQSLACSTLESSYPLACTGVPDNRTVLKVIGPATSTVLRAMYQDDANARATPNVEIYSPLATANNLTLKNRLNVPEPPIQDKQPMKLLRTVNDDGTMAQLMLAELKLRNVDPATSLHCNKEGGLQRDGETCVQSSWSLAPDRIALISEWDSFYSRALIESFKTWVADNAGFSEQGDKAFVDKWVLRFSYLRGLDGRLPEEAASNDKTASSDASKNNKDAGKFDLSPLEKADGNSQLDYLRRLADHIAREDAAYRRDGMPGIGAIGILGVDTYDKLLVLQALKSRMPYKLYFSTDLDARMLQRGQAETTRNLILAAPYGLTLTRVLQQDVPPFRDSLQSSVFVAVQAALAPQSFHDKREKFDYSTSKLLPGIYEVGINGFIPLASPIDQKRTQKCNVQSESNRSDQEIHPHDLMSLDCLQDPSPLSYPGTSKSVREHFKSTQSLFLAGPLTFVLLLLAGFVVWRWISGPEMATQTKLAWARGVPMTLYMIAVACAFIATHFWYVGFLWGTFLLILLGIITSNRIRRLERLAQDNNATASASSGVYDSPSWYIVVPLVVFVLALMLAYQKRGPLTNFGFGEPMFLFEGISAWPTVGLRVAAVLISISALAWGWRNLRVNRVEIERAYQLHAFMRRYRLGLCRQVLHFFHKGRRWNFRRWCNEFGYFLLLIFFPLVSTNDNWSKTCTTIQANCDDERKMISIARFWGEHCICGAFGARLLRALLATWVFIVVTSVLFVIWPMEQVPVRGQSMMWMFVWLIPTLAFQVLVFWVVDANLLLTRFIRHLSNHHAIWPEKLQQEHGKIFGVLRHPCIDEWVDLQLIAKRTSAVSRLIYAPTVVMLILLASRSSQFDNWPTPPSVVISFLLTTLILLASALSLRRAAEKARTLALQRIDAYLLETPKKPGYYEKFQMIRDRIATLNTGSFSRYSEDPLIRALLLSLTGIGGSAIVDALNYAKF